MNLPDLTAPATNPRPAPGALAEEFRAAVAYLLARGYPAGAITVTVAAAGGPQVRFRGALTSPANGKAPERAPPARDPRVPEGARWLSPLGEKVVLVLAGREYWMPADGLAREWGEEKASHELRCLLRDLAERRILESAPNKGYRAMREPTPGPAQPPPWLPLSPLGQKVVEILGRHEDWRTGDQIAKELGDERASNQLRGVLHDMAERGILVALSAKGYRLNRAGDRPVAEPEPAPEDEEAPAEPEDDRAPAAVSDDPGHEARLRELEARAGRREPLFGGRNGNGH
jgi:hypothetical protein